MPENNIPSPAPALPAASQNDQITASGFPVENSRVEKIFSAGGKVFEKFGVVIRRGRGRPRKDGTPKASDVLQPGAGGTVTPAAAAPAAAAPLVNRPVDELRLKIFVSGCVGVLKGAVATAKKWVRRNATAARLDSSFTEKTLAECSPTEDDFKEWGEALEVCAKQYALDFEHMPAVTLAVRTVGIFAPFASLAGEFKKEIERNRQKDIAANTPAK